MPRFDDNIRRRKQRTRGHVIEDLSKNYLERRVLLQDHRLLSPARDYGVDAIMFHCDGDGRLENGEVRFQLKATDSLNVIKDGTVISLPIKTGDLDHWAAEIYPFILVVYDAEEDRAFWLHIQEYVKDHPDCLKSDKKTVNVRVPMSNDLTVESIEVFRKKSLQVFDNV